MAQRTLTKADAPKHPTGREKELGDNDFIVSKTDTKGKIIYCNQIFTQMAGYPAGDLIGANHNLIRHPDMPRLAFKIAWSQIQAKKEFFGFVKNLCADGGYYWVFTYITADLNERGEIISYTSIRRKPPRSAIAAIEPIYAQLRTAEAQGGLEASERLLNELLAKAGTGYDAFIINLYNGTQA